MKLVEAARGDNVQRADAAQRSCCASLGPLQAVQGAPGLLPGRRIELFGCGVYEIHAVHGERGVGFLLPGGPFRRSSKTVMNVPVAGGVGLRSRRLSCAMNVAPVRGARILCL